MKRMIGQPPRSPDFYCIGAQKSGTTWLHANLIHHPGVWMPPVKELQYFNQLYLPAHGSWTQDHRDRHVTRILRKYVTEQDELNLAYIRLLSQITDPVLNDDWYREIFAAAGDRVAGELTPEYSLLPDEGIAHMLRLSPEARVIFMMRDPIDRCWSHIRMIHRTQPDKPLEELARWDDIYKRADYPGILARWRTHIPQDRLLPLLLDEVEARPLELLKRTVEFLGLPFDPAQFPAPEEKVHGGAPLDIPAPIYDTLRERLLPVYETLGAEMPDIAGQWRERHY